MSTLLNQLRLFYGPFGKSNINSTYLSQTHKERNPVYHYIKEAKSLLSQYIYIIYYVRTMRALKTSILEPVLLATQFVLLSSNYIPRFGLSDSSSQVRFTQCVESSKIYSVNFIKRTELLTFQWLFFWIYSMFNRDFLKNKLQQ